jgi:hypothetical protein
VANGLTPSDRAEVHNAKAGSPYVKLWALWKRPTSCQRAGGLCWSLWISGRWPNLFLRHLGASRIGYPSSDVTREWYPPLAGCMWH